MLEKVIIQKRDLERHLAAPLLKERENHIQTLYEKGYTRKPLVRIAAYMLRIIEFLNLSDDEIIPISVFDIIEAAVRWKNSPQNQKGNETSRKMFIRYALQWLPKTGRMDSAYARFKNNLGSLITQPTAIVKYTTTALFSERMAYLEYLRDNNYKELTIERTAMYQLQAIKYLKLDTMRIISMDELGKAAIDYTNNELLNPCKIAGSQQGIASFLERVKGWLRFAGILDESLPPIAGDCIMEEYFSFLLNECGYSDKTISGRRSILRNFLYFLESRNILLKDMSLNDVDVFIAHKSDSGCCRRTTCLIIGTLRKFIEYLTDNGIINDLNIGLGLKAPRVYNLESLPSSPSWECIENALKIKCTECPTDIRNYAILLLLVIYGLRCSEVTNLKLADIDWNNERIMLHRAKMCTPQIFPLHCMVGEAIINYLKNARYNKSKCIYVFRCMLPPYRQMSTSSVYRIVRDCLKMENEELKHYGPHSLRHACATKLINQGFSLKEVADVLGHKLLDTTRIYAKVDMTNLRKVSDINWEDIMYGD